MLKVTRNRFGSGSSVVLTCAIALIILIIFMICGTNLPPVCSSVRPLKPEPETRSWSFPAAEEPNKARRSPALQKVEGSEHWWVGWAEPQLVLKNSAELSKSHLLPGSGQEVLDALSALPAFLQLLWTQGLLRVRLDVTLWDGNLLWFGKLHVGNTRQLQ